MKGRLIVIDGLDGAGKQTQAALLLDRFARAGVPARGISFPDYTHPSSALVKQYLAGEFGQADDVRPLRRAVFMRSTGLQAMSDIGRMTIWRGILLLPTVMRRQI
ncbi:MAG: hypothetical protein ACLSDO_01120 [Anaerotruncus colihominis]